MADYTPDSPKIIGMEWAGIDEPNYLLNNNEEIGTTFTLNTSSTVVSGSAYGVAQDGIPARGVMMSVYPESDLDQSGPIQQVTIQCNGAQTAGAASFLPSPATLTIAQTLASAYDFSFTEISADPGEVGGLFVFFDTLNHVELTGKRILKLELLYRLGGFGGQNRNIDDLFKQNFNSDLGISNIAQSNFTFIAEKETIFTPDLNAPGHSIKSQDLGDVNQFWEPLNTEQFFYPWNYDTLKLFDNGTSSLTRIGAVLTLNNLNPALGTVITFNIQYMALRVTYCEEKRVLVGATQSPWSVGRNMVQLRPPGLLSVGAALSPGRFAVTASRYTLPLDTSGVSNADMTANALVELYPMEAQEGFMIPNTVTAGNVRDHQPSSTLIQLGLHTSSAIVPDVHPYGTQIAAPVWGSATSPARQGIVSFASGSPTSYPYARFYARKSPETIQPLTLRHSVSTSISSSITVAEFDELPEILDGWKEVTLTFAPPLPSFDGAGGLETYEWISTDTVGGQWQVLSQAAPAVTGNFPRVQISGAQSLNAATYAGSTGFLTHSGASDLTADATLMFAQEMPAVSGIGASVQTLAVSASSSSCGVPLDCIPTGIGYVAVTWNALSPSSMPSSGFGYYELQRMDEFTDWQTILHASSAAVTGFSDYEARVGVQSDYRIRFVHRLNFSSAWSSTVSATVPAPGVTGTEVDNGVLIFTSNEVQDGSRSLAYVMQWESDVAEGFTFLEAAESQLQKMYGRDFQVAFRPLERGGSRFQRMLLVQAAAVSSGLIQDGFTSLRDLAWDQLSYVCVRDELGDRWLATVLVPDGKVQRNRRLYMANVDIIEVSDTASIVSLPEA